MDVSRAGPIEEGRDNIGNRARHVPFSSEVVTEKYIAGSECAFVAVAGQNLAFPDRTTQM